MEQLVINLSIILIIMGAFIFGLWGKIQSIESQQRQQRLILKDLKQCFLAYVDSNTSKSLVSLPIDELNRLKLTLLDNYNRTQAASSIERQMCERLINLINAELKTRLNETDKISTS